MFQTLDCYANTEIKRKFLILTFHEYIYAQLNILNQQILDKFSANVAQPG